MLSRLDPPGDPTNLAALLQPYRGLLAAAAICNGLFAASPHLPTWLAAPAFAGVALDGPALAALYAYGLAVLWDGGGVGRPALARLAPGERMSLTNYLRQSLVANLLLWVGASASTACPAKPGCWRWPSRSRAD